MLSDYVFLVCGSFILLKVVVDSPFGWVFEMYSRKRRESPIHRVNVRAYQIAIFMISGMFGALSGGLAALNINGSYPEHAEWMRGARPHLYDLNRGMNSFFGPVVGAAVLVFLYTFLNFYTRYSAFFPWSHLDPYRFLCPHGDR